MSEASVVRSCSGFLLTHQEFLCLDDENGALFSPPATRSRSRSRPRPLPLCPSALRPDCCCSIPPQWKRKDDGRRIGGAKEGRKEGRKGRRRRRAGKNIGHLLPTPVMCREEKENSESWNVDGGLDRTGHAHARRIRWPNASLYVAVVCM